MRVYHGGNLIVEQPRLLPQNRYLDFGPGFYTTTNRDQAIEFSKKVVRREGGGALTEAQALEALKVKRLFDQYVWKTEAALKLLSFTGSFESEGRGA